MYQRVAIILISNFLGNAGPDGQLNLVNKNACLPNFKQFPAMLNNMGGHTYNFIVLRSCQDDRDV